MRSTYKNIDYMNNHNYGHLFIKNAKSLKPIISIRNHVWIWRGWEFGPTFPGQSYSI